MKALELLFKMPKPIRGLVRRGGITHWIIGLLRHGMVKQERKAQVCYGSRFVGRRAPQAEEQLRVLSYCNETT